MIFVKQKRKISQKQRICRVCVYSRIDRRKGYVCKFTGEKPEFYMYCPSFKLYKARDEKIIRSEEKNSFDIVNIIFLAITTIGFLLFALPAKITFWLLPLLFLLFLLVLGIYIEYLPNIEILSIKWYRYLYFVVIGYVLQKKDFDDEDRAVVKQLIISYFGSNIISKANEIFRKDSKKIFKYEKYFAKLTEFERMLIFYHSCKIYIFNNLQNFQNDGLIDKIQKLLDIRKNYADEIKEKLITKEKEFQQKRKAEEKKREKFKEQQNNNRASHKGRRVILYKYQKYYSILGVSEKSTNDEIKKRFKKLALLYHPDRFVNNPQKQHEAQEKFKEFSEAYNFLKNLRGF